MESSLSRIPKLTIPKWSFKWITLVFGFFGFDHWAFGSRSTGIAKLMVNCLTLGSWYTYDVIQAWSSTREDGTSIQANGLQSPFGFIDNIGKGQLDNQPLSNMSKNTQLWLCFLGIGIFGILYYFTGFFISNDSGIVSTILFGIATISFYAGLLLAAFTLYFFFSSYMPATSTQARAGLNPFGVAPSRTGSSVSALSSRLAQAAAFRGGSDEIEMQGGGHEFDAMIETTKKAFEVPKVSKDHLYFSVILLALPLCGFAAYILTKKKDSVKKDEVSGNPRTI